MKKLTTESWDQALDSINKMSKRDIIRLKIFQTRDAMRMMPELKEQFEPILNKLNKELKEAAE